MMPNSKRQLGITLWGMLFVVGTLAFFLFILFKMVPPYLTDIKIKSALDSLGRQPNVATMTVPEIKEAIRKRLEIDSADDFNLDNSLSITPRGKNKVIRIYYESVSPVIHNISLLITFDHSIEVRGAE